MEYRVKIEKRHCIDSSYDSIHSCPLCNAIKEQYPEFELQSVGGSYVRDKSLERYYFDSDPIIGWCCSRLCEIRDGEIGSHTVVFTAPSFKPKHIDITKELAVLPIQETSDVITIKEIILS